MDPSRRHIARPIIMRRLIAIPLLALAIASCSKWPSDAEQHRAYFEQNAATLEAIAMLMDENDFNSVYMGNDGADLYWDRTGGETIERGHIENASDWATHFKAVKSWIVFRSKYGNVHFGLPSSVFRSDVIGSVEVIRELDQSDPLIGCLPEHRVVDCGVCGWRFDESWSLVYLWWPIDLTPEADELYYSGEMSLEEHSSVDEKARRQCAIEGHSVIGYDVSEY